MSSKTLEQEIRRALEDLYRQVNAANKLNLNPNETAQRIDAVEIELGRRLTVEQAAELESAHKTAKIAVDLREVESRKRNNALEAAAIKHKDENTRQMIWDSVGRSTDPSALWQRQRSNEADEILAVRGPEIVAKFDELRLGLAEAIEAISQGNKPDLTFTLAARDEARRPEQLQIPDAFAKRAGQIQEARQVLAEMQRQTADQKMDSPTLKRKF